MGLFCTFLQRCGEAPTPPQHPSPTGQELPGLGENPELQPQGLSVLRLLGASRSPHPPGSSWGVSGSRMLSHNSLEDGDQQKV